MCGICPPPLPGVAVAGCSSCTDPRLPPGARPRTEVVVSPVWPSRGRRLVSECLRTGCAAASGARLQQILSWRRARSRPVKVASVREELPSCSRSHNSPTCVNGRARFWKRGAGYEVGGDQVLYGGRAYTRDGVRDFLTRWARFVLREGFWKVHPPFRDVDT